MIWVWMIALLLAGAPARAAEYWCVGVGCTPEPLTAPATESWCQGDARNLERDMIYNGDKLPPNDRLLMERRLNDAERRCATDSPSARSDLENLRRDMILQSERPRIPPIGGGSWAEPRGSGNGSWTEPRRPDWD